MEDVVLNGISYPVRVIRLHEYEVDVAVSADSLKEEIYDDDGEYTSRDAQLIDELIFFYVPDELMTCSDEDIEQFVIDNLEW